MRMSLFLHGAGVQGSNYIILLCIQKNLTLLNVDVNRKRFINRGKPVNNIITLKVES